MNLVKGLELKLEAYVVLLLLLFSQIKCWLLGFELTKCCQNSKQEKTDQTASSEAIWSGSALFDKASLAGN